MSRTPARTRSADGTDNPPPPSLNMGVLEDRLGFCLRLAQVKLFRELTRRFAPYEVSPLLFSVMTLIDANPGCRQSDVGAALDVKQPNLVEKIDALVGRGLVTRTQDPQDRRANVLSLTPAGRRFLADLDRADLELCDSVAERLGAEDHATLIRVLQRLGQS